MELIDKAAIVAEILNRVKKFSTLDVGGCKELEAIYGAKCHALNSVLSFIDTLEVKEVDLEKEICDWIGDEKSCKDGKWTWYECNKMIRHFFELGLKAQKGE